MKNIFKILMIFYIVSGSFLIVNTFIDSYKYIRFAISAEVTRGRVVELITHRKEDGTFWAPEVEFNVNGKNYSFVSSFKSRSRDHEIGDSVKLFFDPKNPKRNEIYSFTQLWLFPSIGLGVGIFLQTLGIYILYIFAKRKKEIEYLKSFGEKVQLKVIDIRKISRAKVYGRHLFKVFVGGVNPRSGVQEEFESDNLWGHPLVNIGDTVEVLIDRQNPKKYWVNIEPTDLFKAA